jgi:benzoyl-CoA reductase/2-hydroxyglutaryl-CoA dehydratase subunit BcrC/BadD/HgdB
MKMSSEKNILKYLSDTATSLSGYMGKKHPEQLWMVDLQRVYFNMIYEAQEKGIPVVLIGPNYPPELVFALGAVPLLLDCFPSRLASEPLETGVAQYIDLAEKHIPSYICGISKTDLGLVLSGDIGIPDAMIISTQPCDSGRAAYSAIADELNIPFYCIDAPYKRDERGFTYIGKEIKKSVEFLEEVLGKKLDWDRFIEIIKLSNKAYELLGKCAELRQTVPCPLPSRFLVLNEFFGAMVGTPEVITFLQTEYDLGKALAAKGQGAVRGEEKYRIMMLQNPPWYSVSLLDWLEKEYGAVITIDAFGYLYSHPINDPTNEEEVWKRFGERLLGQPMTHGSSGPVEASLEIADDGIKKYKSNLAMFMGHIGCKHTWAAGKLVKDMIYDRYGIQTMTFDLDCIDGRYKSADEVKANIKEFMDTINQ